VGQINLGWNLGSTTALVGFPLLGQNTRDNQFNKKRLPSKHKALSSNPSTTKNENLFGSGVRGFSPWSVAPLLLGLW
jgi:hypothetical protein